MSQHHTTVTRRDFMKALGLIGGGIGYTTATSADLFQDLDEVMSSATASFKRPWWVKDRNFGDPTCEVDWGQIKRMDNRLCMHGETTWLNLVGKEGFQQWLSGANSNIREGIKTNKPGHTLKDVALLSAVGAALHGPTQFVQVPANMKLETAPPVYMWSAAPPPEFFDATQYRGSPEENSRMVRAAMRFMGASQVQFSELGENEKKLIFSRHVRIPKDIVFESVEKGYETSDKFVIPEKPLYIIAVTIQMSKELWRQGDSILRTCANGSRYYVWAGVQARAQGFLNGLGYQGLGYPIRHWGLMPAMADAILTGFAEIGRNNNICISPEYGTITGYFSLLTDLPLAPTPPIDAGIFRFCHTCRKCADACPTGAISHDSETSWEIPNSELIPNADPSWSVTGKKLFHTDVPKCFTKWGYPFCGICMGTCTFNTNDVASIHNIVRSTIGTTSLFNDFLWKADKAFGYGLTADEEKEQWWDHELPVYGYDTTIGSHHGGY